MSGYFYTRFYLTYILLAIQNMHKNREHHTIQTIRSSKLHRPEYLTLFLSTFVLHLQKKIYLF
jgi:hypothetical protein